MMPCRVVPPSFQMAIEIQATIPQSLSQGDTVKWTRIYSDYPSTTWALQYYFSTAQTSATVGRYTGTVAARVTLNKNYTATTDGLGGFAITITATETAALTPGRYQWQARVTSGTEAFVAESGLIDVVPGLSARTDSYDARSADQYMLEQIDAALLAITTNRHASYTIADKTFNFVNLADLRTLRGPVAWRVRVAAGIPTIRYGLKVRPTL